MSLDPVTAVLDIGGKLIDRLWPDPAQRDAAKLEMMKMQMSGELQAMSNETLLAKGQLDVNAVEAASPDRFVSGWRPYIGWVCGTGFAVQFLVGPMCTWLSALFGHPVTFPSLELSTMLPLLGGMLGLGTLRTFEKVKGVA
jgi:hypothetical protein